MTADRASSMQEMPQVFTSGAVSVCSAQAQRFLTALNTRSQPRRCFNLSCFQCPNPPALARLQSPLLPGRGSSARLRASRPLAIAPPPRRQSARPADLPSALCALQRVRTMSTPRASLEHRQTGIRVGCYSKHSRRAWPADAVPRVPQQRWRCLRRSLHRPLRASRMAYLDTRLPAPAPRRPNALLVATAHGQRARPVREVRM